MASVKVDQSRAFGLAVALMSMTCRVVEKSLRIP